MFNLHLFQKKDLLNENGFQSGSSSYESDASSANSSETNLTSEEIDQENTSDFSCKNSNKKLIKNIDHKKISNNSTVKDKPVLPLEFMNLDEESSNRNLNLLNARDEKKSKVDSEVDMQNRITLLPSNDEMKHKNRYCDDLETKNLKKNIEKFKMENVDDFITHLDKDVVKNNPSTKRSTSANNSPYKEKKRKIFLEKTENNLVFSEQGTTNSETIASQKPIVRKVFYSYFERGSDDRDEIREIK